MRGRHNLPAPVQGICTLAEANQPEGMMLEQINMRSDPVRKLSRRPSLEYVTTIDDEVLIGMDPGPGLWRAYHEYSRGGVDYAIGVDAFLVVRVFRDGVEVVTDESNLTGSGYLGANIGDLVIHTIADTTFILNKGVEVLSSEQQVTPPKYAYINVTSALNYGEKVKVTLEWTATNTGVEYGNTSTTLLIDPRLEIEIEIPNADGGDYEAADLARATRAVAEAIDEAVRALPMNQFVNGVFQFETIPNVSTPIVTAVRGSVVSFETDAELKDLTLSADGGQGEDSLVLIQTIKQDTTGMPKYAIEGTVVEIQPGLDTGRDDTSYFLIANKVDESIVLAGTMREVFWEETADPFAANGFDGSTMPVVVVQETVPTVSNNDAQWEIRRAGNNTSSPLPEFVGDKIGAIATFQGRLVLASGDAVMMSDTENLFLFFRKSVLQLLATDTISLGSASSSADIITGMAVHNQDLVINFPERQFKVSGSAAVTPQTTAMTPSTAYETIGTPVPLPFGSSLLLPFTYGESGGVWDYTQMENNDQNTATAMTQLAEGYMIGDIDLWTSNISLDIVVAKCTAENKLYILEQNTRNGQKTQLSWSSWELTCEDDLLWMGFDGNILNLVYRSTDLGTIKRQIDLNTVLPDAPDNIFLDDRIRVDVLDGETTATLPEGYPPHGDLVYVQAANCKSPYYKVAATRDGDTITVPLSIHVGGQTSTLYIGRPYTSEFKLARPYIRDDSGIVNIDKLRLKKFHLGVVHTSLMSMDVESDYYDTTTQQVRAERVGSMQLGVKSFYTGTFQYSFRKQAELARARFYTEEYLPMNIVGIMWEALYHQRTRRL